MDVFKMVIFKMLKVFGWLRSYVRLWFCSPSLAWLGRCQCRSCGMMRNELIIEAYAARDVSKADLDNYKRKTKAKRKRAGELVAQLTRDLAKERQINTILQSTLDREMAELKRLHALFENHPRRR